MIELAATTYILELDSLNGAAAIFSSDLHGALVELPREDWRNMVRPGRITITPREAAS